MPDSASASTSEMPINSGEGASSSSSYSAQNRGREEEENNYNNMSYDESGGQAIPFRHREVEEHDFHNHNHHHHIDDPYTGNNFTRYDGTNAGPNVVREDTWSCVIVVLTFWFFVSMTLILGVYGAVSMKLGPYSSILIEPNPIFVGSVKVEQLDNTKPGPIVYGFYKTPLLDDVVQWSETHNISVNADSHLEWIHYLNPGSQINISYSVKSSGSSIFLIVAEGNEGLSQWLEDPTYPNTTLSWNVVHGSGMVQQEIYRSSSYYVAVGNLNSERIQAELNITLKASLYNTTEAYNKCGCADGACSFSVLFPEGTSVVLTSPGLGQDTSGDGWYVKVSYGPRWLTYIMGVGGMTTLMLLVFNFLNKFQSTREANIGVQHGETGSEQAPLLSYKDDDLSSWGSSYDSVSNDEEDVEEFLAAEGKLKDRENNNNTRRLCAICFDAPRDCFFLPCGHCVACFECGSRIAEADGTCPICRRKFKKVRKIFTV